MTHANGQAGRQAFPSRHLFSHTRHGGKRASGSESESQIESKVRPVVLTTVHIRARAHRLARQAVL
jgi:hypothetical protein